MLRGDVMKFTNDQLEVHTNDGEFICYLNEHLVNKQGLNSEDVAALKATHRLRHALFDIARLTTSVEGLKALAAFFDALEAEQQSLWKFDVNKDFRRFFDFPGCVCPKLDNIDRLGTPYHVISVDCPIHGGSVDVGKD